MTRHTLADSIVDALTDEIVGKRLAPGAELDETRVAERFGASRTPVREALRQLAASGLVELRPHRTPLVATIDERKVGEMFEVMAELEAVCAARAAQMMAPAARAGLERHHIAMGAAMRAADVAAYRRGNLVLHAMIYDGAGNGYLRDLALATRERLAPYRGAQLEAPSRLAKSWAEHDAIITAIMRGQGEQAAALMRAHLSETRETVAGLVASKMPNN
jgi:DNA-binding GntR family transcriptional regulator